MNIINTQRLLWKSRFQVSSWLPHKTASLLLTYCFLTLVSWQIHWDSSKHQYNDKRRLYIELEAYMGIWTPRVKPEESKSTYTQTTWCITDLNYVLMMQGHRDCAQRKRCYYMVNTASRTRCTNGYCLTCIETGKIFFKLQTNASNFYTINRQPFCLA